MGGGSPWALNTVNRLVDFLPPPDSESLQRAWAHNLQRSFLHLMYQKGHTRFVRAPD